MDDLINAMLNYAFDHNIGFALIKLKPSTPSMAEYSKRVMIININWANHNEIPFIIAHEIAHILNGDVNLSYYGEYSSVNWKKENKANLKAIELLIPVYFKINYDYSYNNVVPIMEQLCIPFRYLEYVKKYAKKYIWYR